MTAHSVVYCSILNHSPLCLLEISIWNILSYPMVPCPQIAQRENKNTNTDILFYVPYIMKYSSLLWLLLVNRLKSISNAMFTILSLYLLFKLMEQRKIHKTVWDYLFVHQWNGQKQSIQWIFSEQKKTKAKEDQVWNKVLYSWDYGEGKKEKKNPQCISTGRARAAAWNVLNSSYLICFLSCLSTWARMRYMNTSNAS